MGNRAVYFFCSPRLVSLSLLRAYGATACCQQSHQFLWISITFHTMENFRMFRTVEHFFPYFFCVFVSLREENFCNVFLLRQYRVEMDGVIWVKNDSEFKTNEWSTSAIYGPTQWHECVVFFFFFWKTFIWWTDTREDTVDCHVQECRDALEWSMGRGENRVSECDAEQAEGSEGEFEI